MQLLSVTFDRQTETMFYEIPPLDEDDTPSAFYWPKHFLATYKEDQTLSCARIVISILDGLP